MASIKNLKPFFITGCWRSGTTLISRVLNAHQDICVSYDTVHFMRFIFKKYDPIENIQNVKKLLHDTNIRLNKRSGINLSEKEVLDAVECSPDYPSIYNAIMGNLFLNKTNFSIWGEKTNLAWRSIQDFLCMFPDGRVIHVIRDPRAVLLSWKKFTYAPGNLYLDSLINCLDSMQYAKKLTEKLSTQNYKVIKYEDFVQNPEKLLKSLCSDLEIVFDRGMLNPDNYLDNNGNNWSPNTAHETEINGISKAVINKWEEELEPWEIHLADTLLDNVNSIFKYESHTDLQKDKALLDIRIIREIEKCSFVSNGLIYYLLTGEGVERYPSDPLDENNWEVTVTNNLY